MSVFYEVLSVIAGIISAFICYVIIQCLMG